MTRRLLYGFLGLSLALGVWYVAARLLDPKLHVLFPPPERVVQALTSNYARVLEFSLATWGRVLAGLSAGAVLGTSIAFLMSMFPRAGSLLDPIVEAVRPVPPIALTPFFIIWFGIGFLGQFALVTLGCLMVCVVNGTVAIRSIDPVIIRAARSLGADRGQLYRLVYFPAALPSVLGGLRVASGTAFGLAVAAEYLGAQGGLGYMIRNARVTLETPAIALAILLIAAQSILTDAFLRQLELRLTWWNPRPTDAVEGLEGSA